MQTKLKLITVDPTLTKWGSFQTKIREVTKALNTVKNSDFQIDVEYLKLEPVVVDGYVTHSYMDTISKVYWDAGYDFVAIHFGSKQWKQFKLKEGLRGLHQRDTDEIYELYFWADETTLRQGLNQFIQTFLHEVSHALAKGQGVADKTHEYHDANRDIRGILPTYDINEMKTVRGKLRKELSLWQKVFEASKAFFAIKNQPKALLPLVQRQADKVLSEMSLLGYEMRITQGFRSIEEQNKLYAQGRTTPGKIVTNAKGGESYHNWGCAVDFVFRKQGYDVPNTVWQTFGKIGKKHGFAWGGDWKSFPDKPHLEMTLGYRLSDFTSGRVDYKKFN